MAKIGTYVWCATAATAAMLWSGCQTPPPKPSGFLSDYSHLQKVDDSTWRYVDSSRLGACSEFNVPPVEVMVKEYWGTTFTPDQKKRVADIFRLKVINALTPRYKVAVGPGPKTPDIRVAITQAYRVGNALALGVEAEIVDPASHQQLAALRGVRIGPPDMSAKMGYHNPADPSRYTPAWWDWPSAVELMERWADQIRQMIDEGHKR
jgi:hypothetical protein